MVVSVDIYVLFLVFLEILCFGYSCSRTDTLWRKSTNIPKICLYLKTFSENQKIWKLTLLLLRLGEYIHDPGVNGSNPKKSACISTNCHISVVHHHLPWKIYVGMSGCQIKSLLSVWRLTGGGANAYYFWTHWHRRLVLSFDLKPPTPRENGTESRVLR